MENQQIIKNIKQTILECLNEKGITVKKIILFGSRAMGNFERESDFDLLIILDKNLLPKEKKELWYLVSKTLHKYYHTIPFDIIIKSEQSFKQEKDIVNTISNEVHLEGIEI
jgi:predicted nucleotidyltransferase